MDEKIEKAFIPRKRIDPMSAGLRIESTVSIFTAIALIVFTLAFFASIAVFVSNIFIAKSITTEKENLVKLSKEFDTGEINTISSLDKKVNAVSGILKNHISLSKILRFLEENTASKVMIDSISFVDGSNSVIVTMQALAKNYNTLANQSAIFKENKAIKSFEISAVEPTDTSEVIFTAELIINRNAFSFKEIEQ